MLLSGRRSYVLIPACLLIVLLIVHSVRVRGVRNTIALLLTAFPFFWIRERVAAENPVYVLTGAITIGGAPLTPIVGWFFSSYCSLWLAESILERWSPRRLYSVFPTVALATIGAGAIGLLVEAAGQSAGWWHVTASGQAEFDRHALGYTNFMYGWTSTCALYMSAFLLTESLLLRSRALRSISWKHFRWIPGMIAIAIAATVMENHPYIGMAGILITILGAAPPLDIRRRIQLISLWLALLTVPVLYIGKFALFIYTIFPVAAGAMPVAIPLRYRDGATPGADMAER